MLKKLLFTGLSLFLLTLTACGTDTTNDNTNNVNNTATPQEVAPPANDTATSQKNVVEEYTEQTVSPTQIMNPTVTFDKALEIFKNAHPKAKVESIDFESDYGQLYYDFEGYDEGKEYEMKIDAQNGEVMEHKAEKELKNDEFINFSSIISPKRAIEIASQRAETQGLTLTGWTLEVEVGKQIYKIEYDKANSDDDLEIIIDAETEKILAVKHD